MFKQPHQSIQPGDACTFYLVLFDKEELKFDLG